MEQQDKKIEELEDKFTEKLKEKAGEIMKTIAEFLKSKGQDVTYAEHGENEPEVDSQ